MRRNRILQGIAVALLAGLGTAACTFNATCNCILSTAASKFAYVMLEFDTIAAFTITPGTGSLVPVSGSPFGGNISPVYGAADPAGKFLYAVVPNAGTVNGFSIDQTTGALTAVPGSPFTLGPSEARVPIVDPSGRFLYVTHLDSCGDSCHGAISAFKIGTDGSLTKITGSPFSTLSFGTLGIAVHPSGKFVFAVNGRNTFGSLGVTISVFSVDPTSGALTQITGSPFQAGEAIPLFAAVHPNGNFLYVIEQNLTPNSNGFVVAFSIDPTSGALAPISGFSKDAGVNPQGIDVDAIDNFLLVANTGVVGDVVPVDGSISAYRMDGTTGALTPLSGSPFATTGSNPFQLAVDRSCKFLYATNTPRTSAGNYVLAFAINTLTGSLTAVPGSPFATPSGGPPEGIVLTPHRAAGSTGP